MPRKAVSFTHTDKVFFPEAGFTKGDLIKYYLDVSRHMLPHLRGRPITLIRFPDGIQGEHFYEKNAPAFTPDWIETYDAPRRHEGGSIHYLLINSPEALAWCANIAGLEIHPFLHRAKAPDWPTDVIFDLDPGEGATLATCARVALLIRGLLKKLGLEAFAKVSGSKGIQVYVPLNTAVTYDQTGAFAKAVGDLLYEQHPDLVLTEMAKVRRKGKVFVDWSQNNASKTTVAVYSVRGKGDRPFVSMPLTWAEVAALSKARGFAKYTFTPGAAVKRLKSKGDLFAPILTLKQFLPKKFATAATRSAGRALSRYSAKRDFGKTGEPSGDSRTPDKTGHHFVIQKHAASHLHYDFRLEMDGTLKSWAVPKGLSTERNVKRSAFEVEDHPIAYMSFEGTIPRGQYGGGTVMVWDAGTYDLLSGTHDGGNLKIVLHGKKLKGEWHLFRIRSENNKPVWLVVRAGESAAPISARADDRSVISGRSMDRIASENDRQWRSAH